MIKITKKFTEKFKVFSSSFSKEKISEVPGKILETILTLLTEIGSFLIGIVIYADAVGLLLLAAGMDKFPVSKFIFIVAAFTMVVSYHYAMKTPQKAPQKVLQEVQEKKKR